MHLTPQIFGAIGDGKADDTAALQSFFRTVGDGVDGRLDGAYRVSSLLTVSGKSNFTIFGRGSIITGDNIPANDAGGGIRFIDCSEFALEGFTVNGNRANRTPANAGAHCINFRSCHDFKVVGVKALNSCTDGFYVASSTPSDSATHSSRFVFEDCIADNCYRNGVSIIQANNGGIIGGAYSNANGSAPAAGVDLESNAGDADHAIESIYFERVLFSGNAGVGLQVSSRCNPRDIKVRGCRFIVSIAKAIDWGCTERGIIEDCLFDGAGDNLIRGVIDLPYSVVNGKLDIIRPTFRNMGFGTPAQWLIYIDANSAGKVRISGLDCDACYQVVSLGPDCTIEDSDIRAVVGAVGIFAGTGGDRCKALRNRISNFASAAIYLSGDNVEVVGNVLLEPSGNNSNGCLRVLQAGATVDRNYIYRASSASGYGIRLDASFRSLQDNCVSGFTGNPLYLTGTSGSETVGFKKRNMVNSARAVEN